MWPFNPPDLTRLEAEKNISALIKVLGSKKFDWMRSDAAKALGRIGDKSAIESLIACIRDGDKDVCTASVEALGRFGDVRAVEPLITAFTDSQWVVRCEIARSLGMLGDHRAIGPLIDALSDEDSYVREYSIEALTRLGDVRAVAPLIIALSDETRSVRKEAIKALTNIAAPKKEALFAALSYEDGNVRRTVARILRVICQKDDPRTHTASFFIAQQEWDRCAELGEPAILPLTVVLKDKDSHLRFQAAATLDIIGWEPDPGEQEAIYCIAKALWDRCVEMGVQTLQALIDILEDKDPGVREGAVGALGRIGDVRAKAPLISRLTDKDSDVRSAAAAALPKIGWTPSHEEEAANYCVASRQWDRCAEMGTTAIPPLLIALNDKDSDVRLSAAETLYEIGWKPASEKEQAVFYVAHQDWSFCSSIFGPGPLAEEPLLVALVDKKANVRLAAAETLDEIRWKPYYDREKVEYWIAKKRWDRCVEIGKSAVELLIAALKDKEPEVRSGAVEALGKIGDPRALKPLMDCAMDENSMVRLSQINAMHDYAWKNPQK